MASNTLFAGPVPINYDNDPGALLFEPYALDLAERLKNAKLEHLPDLACGTCRVTSHLLPLMPHSGRLVATDMNLGMVEVGRSKIQSDKIQCQVADARAWPS